MKKRPRKRRVAVPLERDIQKSVLAEMRLFYLQVRVRRQNTGVAGYQGKGDRFRPVRFGTPGQADLTCTIRPSGQRLEIEIKRPGGKLTELQKRFRDETREDGAIYMVVRSVEELHLQMFAEGILSRTNAGGGLRP